MVVRDLAERVLALYEFFLDQIQTSRSPQVGDEQVAAILTNATIIWQAETELEEALPDAGRGI